MEITKVNMNIFIRKSIISCVRYLIGLLLLFNISCVNREKGVSAYIVAKGIFSQTKIDTVLFDAHVSNNKSIVKLKYLYEDHIVDEYILDTLDYSNCEYYRNNAKIDFVFVKSHLFYINGKKYIALKYSSNFQAADGCINHFYVPNIGFILINSRTWGNYQKMWLDNTLQNEIDILIELMILNYKFYYGCVDDKGIPEKIILDCFDDIPNSPPDSLQVLDLVELR